MHIHKLDVFHQGECRANSGENVGSAYSFQEGRGLKHYRWRRDLVCKAFILLIISFILGRILLQQLACCIVLVYNMSYSRVLHVCRGVGRGRLFGGDNCFSTIAIFYREKAFASLLLLCSRFMAFVLQAQSGPCSPYLLNFRCGCIIALYFQWLVSPAPLPSITWMKWAPTHVRCAYVYFTFVHSAYAASGTRHFLSKASRATTLGLEAQRRTMTCSHSFPFYWVYWKKTMWPIWNYRDVPRSHTNTESASPTRYIRILYVLIATFKGSNITLLIVHR